MATTIPRAGGKLGPPMLQLIRRQTGKSEDEFVNP